VTDVGGSVRIIVAEGQEAMRRVIVSYLQERRFQVIEVGSATDLEIHLKNDAGLLLLDAALIQGHMSAFLDRVQELQSAMPVIVMSHQDIISESMEALQRGAVDYLIKPFPVEMLEAAIERALSRDVEGVNARAGGGKSFVKLDALPSVQRNPAMRKAVGLLHNVADSDITVLISGESGVGKEIFAQMLHQRSRRRGHQFVDINCASVPASLLEAELFGSERGAYTGALNRRIGKFELANKGTIFLDEVSEMDVALQAKLLRVIQEKQLYRVGGEQKIHLNVRIVATTNRDLRAWVREGKFREDLYYRLNVIGIHVPPLRERLEDIPVLAQHIIDRFNNENRKNLVLTMDAVEQLCQYPWPGNIRELENVLFLTAFLTPGPSIKKIHFQEEPLPIAAAPRKSALPVGTLEEMERDMIRQALRQHTGNRTHAAQTLGISVRTLRNKLRLYPEIDPFAVSEAAAELEPTRIAN